MFSSREVLEMAIRIEKNGEKAYRDAIKSIGNQELTALLIWMADEELKHAEWFSELKENLTVKSRNPFLEEMSYQLFNDLLAEQSFSLKDANFAAVERISTLISVFIEFEKDSIIFYETLQPFIEEEEALKQIRIIIEEENLHIKQLQEFILNEEPLTAAMD